MLGLSLALLLGLAFSSPSAQESKKGELEGDIEIGGLLMEEVRTKIGQDFFHEFCLSWEASKGEDLEKVRLLYNILIEEFTSPQWGSLIQIKVNDAIVYQRPVTPRAEEIEEAARRAVQVVRKYILDRDVWERGAIDGGKQQKEGVSGLQGELQRREKE
jgi:hypothetical protein